VDEFTLTFAYATCFVHSAEMLKENLLPMTEAVRI
jgi:hypothetical protein